MFLQDSDLDAVASRGNSLSWPWLRREVRAQQPPNCLLWLMPQRTGDADSPSSNHTRESLPRSPLPASNLAGSPYSKVKKPLVRAIHQLCLVSCAPLKLLTEGYCAECAAGLFLVWVQTHQECCEVERTVPVRL